MQGEGDGWSVLRFLLLSRYLSACLTLNPTGGEQRISRMSQCPEREFELQFLDAPRQSYRS